MVFPNRKILKKIALLLFYAFKIRSILRKFDIFLDENVILKDTVLSGKIYIGSNSTINQANISGSFSAKQGLKIFSGGTNIEGNVEIGRFTSLNGPNFDIESGSCRVIIGSFCSLARNVNILAENHRTDRITSYFICQHILDMQQVKESCSKGDIIIENDVWIGTQCVVLSGAHISTGCVIAANSVVTGFIPPYAIAGGSPAKVIKFRFPQNEINALLESKWWEWSEDKLKENKLLFSNKLDIVKLKSVEHSRDETSPN
jgi:virginiamycin A acetyltransferase